MTLIIQPPDQTYFDYPEWITPPYLGSFVQDYSFDLNPISIIFGASTNSIVSVLNGTLPSGLSYQQNYNTINIVGSAVESTTTIFGQITFRISQTNGAIADRTFFINLTPIALAPNWINQTTFLGYQNNLSVVQYILQAKSESGNALLYDLPTHPANSQINPYTGVFTFNSTAYTSPAQITTTVRATDVGNSTSNNVNVTVDVVTVSGPNWITPQGSLGIFYSDTFVELNLVAQDPFDNNLTYYLNEPSQTLTGWGQVWDDEFGYDNDNIIHLPINVSQTGVLYGMLPPVVTDTIYTFKVVARSSNKSATALFTLTNSPVINTKTFYWKTTSSDLGTWNEGQYVEISVLAETNRGTAVVYNITGGLLPPHLMIGTTTGQLVGFLEYTAINKTYYFDITAYDGTQLITQQFSITVNKVYSSQFLSAYIPITGSLRDSWLSDTRNIRIREPGQIIYDSIINPPNNPFLSVISGLETGFATPKEIVSKISPWVHQLSLQIGSAANTSPQSNGLSTVYRNISDYQSKSNIIINSDYVEGNKVYPISIFNIRQALIDTYPWILSGGGKNFAIFPNLNWNTGSIQSVTVLDSGSGFLSPPNIVIGGAGTGAQLKAHLGLVNVTVIDPGRGWNIGQQISIPGFDAISPGVLRITSISPLGGIVTLEIINPGDYSNVGQTQTIQLSIGSAYAEISPNWGVVDVSVLNGGENYQCGITINVSGGELLPSWQTEYNPIIEVGQIKPTTAQDAATLLNSESNSLYGTLWQPNYLVLQWQGLTYIGSTIFDQETTTFDGGSTRFEDTESPYDTIFDDKQEQFDNSLTIFDYQDPLAYDFQTIWGSTILESGATVFDLYSTILDAVPPRTYSNTRLRRWYNTQNKIYSGNNAVV